MVFEKGVKHNRSINPKIDSGEKSMQGEGCFDWLTAEHRAKVTSYCSNIPNTLKNAFKKAWSKKSKATAIKAKCYDCVGYEDIKYQVGDCRSLTCPLWPYRPRQK